MTPRTYQTGKWRWDYESENLIHLVLISKRSLLVNQPTDRPKLTLSFIEVICISFAGLIGDQIEQIVTDKTKALRWKTAELSQVGKKTTIFTYIFNSIFTDIVITYLLTYLLTYSLIMQIRTCSQTGIYKDRHTQRQAYAQEVICTDRHMHNCACWCNQWNYWQFKIQFQFY